MWKFASECVVSQCIVAHSSEREQKFSGSNDIHRSATWVMMASLCGYGSRSSTSKCLETGLKAQNDIHIQQFSEKVSLVISAKWNDSLRLEEHHCCLLDRLLNDKVNCRRCMWLVHCMCERYILQKCIINPMSCLLPEFHGEPNHDGCWLWKSSWSCDLADHHRCERPVHHFVLVPKV